jgi:hypothetical protein
LSNYLGNYAAGDMIDFKFTSIRPSTGAPHTLAGTPAISVYKANGTTESTTGVTLSADFDSRTGVNHVRIDTSADGSFYAAGGQFDVMITAGSIDSVSAAGVVVGRFTLEVAGGLATAAALATVDDFLDTEVAAIKAKTDNLPSDPADASDIATAFSGVNTKLDTIDDFLDTEVAAIKAKTDNLPSDPADASDIATAVSGLDAKLDTIDNFLDTEIAAIKTVTDQLVAAHAEPSGVPAADETPLDKLGYLFMALRNAITISSTKKQFHDDAGNVEWEKDIDNVTNYTETKGNAP